MDKTSSRFSDTSSCEWKSHFNLTLKADSTLKLGVFKQANIYRLIRIF